MNRKKKRKTIVIEDDEEDPKRVRYTHALSAYQTKAKAALLKYMGADVAWLCVQYSSTALDYLPTILGNILTNNTLMFIANPSPQPNMAVRMEYRLDLWGTRAFIRDNYKQKMEDKLVKQVRLGVARSVSCGDSLRRVNMFCGVQESFDGRGVTLTQDEEPGFLWKLLDAKTRQLTTHEERIASAARHIIKKTVRLNVAKPRMRLAVQLRPWKSLGTLVETRQLLRKVIEEEVLMDMRLGSLEMKEFQVVVNHSFVGGGKGMIFAHIDLDLSG